MTNEVKGEMFMLPFVGEFAKKQVDQQLGV
jgi:uncharacterized membrane protein